MDTDRGNKFESLRPLREDKFDYCNFLAEGNPEGVLLAKQIQAQSYLNMGFVQPEGLITLETGEQILAPDVADPSDLLFAPQERQWTEYSLGVEKGSTDVHPITGKMVAWKKRFAPLDTLPTYNYCKDHLWPGWEEYLRQVDSDPYSQLAEPEALGKTINAGRGVVIEFMRNEIQRAYGRKEVWFMGLVEKTVYKTFVRNWGPLAVEQVGESKRLDHPHVDSTVKLTPTIMDIDNFYLHFYYHLQAREASGELTDKELEHFVYMTSGLSDEALGRKLATFRAKIRTTT